MSMMSPKQNLPKHFKRNFKHFSLEIDGRNMIIELEQRTTRRKVSNGKSHNGFSSSRRGNVVVTVLIVIFFLVMSQILRSFSHCKLSKCFGNRVC